MKFNNVNSEVQNKALELLNNAENKSQAIVEVFEMLNAESHKELIEQLQIENEQLKADSQYAEKLGLRNLSQNEKAFYEKLVKANQSVTFTQGDIIPSEVIDRTLQDVKAESDTLKLVNFAPAGVKKWLAGSHSGSASWGKLSDALISELTAIITGMSIEVNKLYVMLIVPKAVRELALPLVDRYFSAILSEAMHDGLVDGYLNGDGKSAPIGITKKINEVNTGGDHKAKSKATSVTGFSPKQLAPVLSALSNGGKRTVNKLYLIANPTDVYSYVNPSLYYQGQFGVVPTTNIDIEVIAEPKCATGTGIFTIADAYVMGMSGITVDEFKETKALDDADLFIAKAYANGRADDDNTAYVFDTTKLVEFVPTINTKTVGA